MNELFTLLIRLEGPMQSWGYRSRFDYRDTALEPTRSGVIGLICAAIGLARGADISRFDSMRMGVRVDREGRLERDYHTALNVIKADSSGKDTVVSYRDYLADASFTVGLESNNKKLLEEIAEALCNPSWALFLGRKAFCLAEHPLSVSGPPIIQATLRDALEGAPFSLTCKPTDRSEKYRLILESPDGERTQMDRPLCFEKRRFTVRHIHTDFITISKRGA